MSYSSSPFLHGCLIKSKHGRRGGGGSGVVSTHRVDGKPKEEEEESHHIYIKTDSCRERRQGCQLAKDHWPKKFFCHFLENCTRKSTYRPALGQKLKTCCGNPVLERDLAPPLLLWISQVALFPSLSLSRR